jgi:hypothetical protein
MTGGQSRTERSISVCEQRLWAVLDANAELTHGERVMAGNTRSTTVDVYRDGEWQMVS